MKTPDYVLMEKVTMYGAGGTTTELEAGTFVRPIEYVYLPRHIKDRYENFNSQDRVFCYTPLGIFLLDKNMIRKV